MPTDRPRFYTDCHIGWQVAAGLRARSIDVQTCMDVHLLSASDDVHLAHAAAAGRVLVSRDRDFSEIHWRAQDHAGIVILTGSDEVGALVRAITLVHLVYTAEEMRNRLEFVKAT